MATGKLFDVVCFFCLILIEVLFKSDYNFIGIARANQPLLQLLPKLSSHESHKQRRKLCDKKVSPFSRLPRNGKKHAEKQSGDPTKRLGFDF